MTDDGQDRAPTAARQPLLNLPPMVAALLLINIAVHVGRALLPLPVDDWLLQHFAFIPARYGDAALFGWPAFAAPLSSQFLHAD